jgi:SHS2 domain-containing protein
LDHPADYAMAARGHDLRELIENAARGFIALTADVSGLTPSDEFVAEVTGDSREQVLVHAVKELLHLREDGYLPIKADVVEAGEASCMLRVGAVELGPVAERVEAVVKAVTYHDLHIVEEAGVLSARLVLDT